MTRYKNMFITMICISAVVMFYVLPLSIDDLYKSQPVEQNKAKDVDKSYDGISNMVEGSKMVVHEKTLFQGTFQIPTLPARQQMLDRYLFPIVNFYGGPNFQYRQFKIAVQMAVNTSRTIVLSDFKHHLVDIVHYPLMGRVDFNETFDVEVLADFLPIMTIAEFRAKCGPTVTNVLTAYHVKKMNVSEIASNYEPQRTWLKERADITIPDAKGIARTSFQYTHLIEEISEEKCVVMVTPIYFEKIPFPQQEIVAGDLDKHLIRTKLLRQAVDSVMPQLCGGRPILGFHWRNKTGEQCRIGHLAAERSARCNNLSQVQQQMLKILSADIKRIIDKYEIGCMFVAYYKMKNQSMGFMNTLSSSISNIITMSEVVRLHQPHIESLQDNDYFTSLVEQEICARSKVYIGNGRSNWSNFIFQERKAFGKGPNYDIITDFPNISNVVESCV
ncbi:uncharacterized protein LOC144438207 [Glandiceps talaboti]